VVILNADRQEIVRAQNDAMQNDAVEYYAVNCAVPASRGGHGGDQGQVAANTRLYLHVVTQKGTRMVCVYVSAYVRKYCSTNMDVTDMFTYPFVHHNM